MSGESFCGFCVGWEGGLWLVIAWCRKWETTKSCVSRHNCNSLLEERFGNVCVVGQIPYTFKELEGWGRKGFLFPLSELCLHRVLQIDLSLLGQADELRAALKCSWNLGCWPCLMIRCSRGSRLLARLDELVFAWGRLCRHIKVQETPCFPVILVRDMQFLPTPAITARDCVQILTQNEHLMGLKCVWEPKCPPVLQLGSDGSFEMFEMRSCFSSGEDRTWKDQLVVMVNIQRGHNLTLACERTVDTLQDLSSLWFYL